jgi:hypothetical protein
LLASWALVLDQLVAVDADVVAALDASEPIGGGGRYHPADKHLALLDLRKVRQEQRGDPLEGQRARFAGDQDFKLHLGDEPK